MTLSLGARSAALTLGLLAAGCSDAVDQAAKKRIFSPEDPPAAVASAREALPVDGLEKEPERVRRIVRMGAAEATERLGAHRFTAALTFEWTGPNGAVKLVENRTLLAGAGGVNGDFHASMDNSRDQGLEVMRVHGQVFARDRYGKFRQRLRDRGIAERMREEVRGALRDVDVLFRGRLALEPKGATVFQERPVQAYAITLGAPLDAAPAELPPPARPKDGLDDTTQRRLGFLESRVPRSAKGEVMVDKKTGVVLAVRFEGLMSTPREGESADLKLVLDAQVDRLGQVDGFKPPEGYLPDQDKPAGIAAALERFGIPRNVPDAGTPEAETAVPDDD